MRNVQVSVRISPHLYEKLLTHANSLDTSKSKVIANALAKYLEGEETQPQPIDLKLKELEKRISILESSSTSSPSISRNPNVIPLSSTPVSPPPLQKFTFEVIKVDNKGEITEKNPGQAEYFRENLGNELGLDLVKIPGGNFLMGSSPTDPRGRDCERPQHTVTLKDFFLSKFPITQAQWCIVAGFPKIKRDLDRDPSCFKGNKRPVERISWEDAVEFCDRLSQYSQRRYRLPSESQWEYACRAGTTTAFYFGPTLTENLANYMAKRTYGQEAVGEYRQETTPVGQFPPNAFGLYDLHGNVWEWCADHWHPNYWQSPTSQKVWFSDNPLNYRVLRGGSWDYDATYCGCAYRYSYHPQANPLNQIGFRVLWDLDQCRN